ncbi:hypothetical protein TUM4438_18280 [Shewanella sairae]|uniref:Uncharacterized protein n=1 Tax=Shewanella sairae TaxID=190310 RepID=A0ABQ4PCH5_9GAMM|nr:hypothetical protein [Shewanella sairae]MCL1130925.1 hypothetical protein [Shewanella sairae]GIU45243.1 hypothetical protein TUM4438_18280 [Shewanella sairae]
MYKYLVRSKQDGQASVEYIVVCSALVAALLTPIQNNQNVMDLCLDSLKDWYTAFAYSKSLPTLPN